MTDATDTRRAALRDAVLDAPEARIASAGLAGLGMRGVAERAGCSPGMIYKLFPNHDALVLAVNARTLAAIRSALAASVAGADGAREAMCRMADAYLGYALDNTPRWDALFTHRMADGASVPDWYASLRGALFAQLAQAVAALLPDAAAPEVDALARTLFSAVHGAVALGLEQKVGSIAPDALARQVRMLVGLMADGLAAPGSRQG